MGLWWGDITVHLYSHDREITRVFGVKLKHKADINPISEYAADQFGIKKCSLIQSKEGLRYKRINVLDKCFEEKMSTMPGLPTRPCFYDIDLDPVTEQVKGLF
ncbi:hypothetical protein BTVI_137741 [Pitangus sulphuratus]|nr:hypothetical protein BTVI_137741 [Pitangus sulphuratus]